MKIEITVEEPEEPKKGPAEKGDKAAEKGAKGAAAGKGAAKKGAKARGAEGAAAAKGAKATKGAEGVAPAKDAEAAAKGAEGAEAAEPKSEACTLSDGVVAPREERPKLPVRSTERDARGAYDLHTHSTFSDGSCTVDELIGLARERGLGAMAITDHDCLCQLSEVRERARALGFPVLAGIEASAFDPARGRKVHVLGYCLEATPEGDGPIERIVNETLRARTANTLWQAWVLQREGAEFGGHTVSLDEVCAVAGDSTGVYKQHVMEALTSRPYVDPDYQFACWCNLKGESPANHDISYPDAVAVVRAIREQGGVPVLAHPGQLNSWDLVPDLVKAGLMGIEAFHPDHTEADEERVFELARTYGLFVTGGSDFHGRYGRPEAPGCRFVRPEEAGEPVQELFEREAALS